MRILKMHLLFLNLNLAFLEKLYDTKLMQIQLVMFLEQDKTSDISK